MLSKKSWEPEGVIQLALWLSASYWLGLVAMNGLFVSHKLSPTQLEFMAVAIGTVSFHLMALFLTYRFLRKEAIGWTEAFGFMTPRLGRALLLALLVAVAATPIAWSLGDLSAKIMKWIHLKPALQAPVEMLQSTASLTVKSLIGLLAIILAPFAEEVLFRGLLYPTLKQHGFPRLALWGTSVFFAASHCNLMTFIPLTFLAVVFALLYQTTGNLLAPIFAHSIFNLVGFVCALTQRLIPSAVPAS